MLRKHKIMAAVAFVILICGVIYLYRMMFPRYKVADKEAATAFVLEHQPELNNLVERMKEEYEKEKRENKILLIEGSEFPTYSFLDDFKWLKQYRIVFIAIDKSGGPYKVDILFADAPSGYEYFSIYFSENDEPLGWEDGSELKEEKEGFFVQRGSYYILETEKITDHWYYYQCRT